MNRSFRKDVAIQAMMYIIKKLGGRTDMHKLNKILYFADQQHLSLYGRSITGDRYIAMQYGPVPSMVDDMMKAVRGDSYFSGTALAAELKVYLKYVNRFIIEGLKDPDMDYLSESDVECLDKSIDKCKDLSFEQLSQVSHGLAWGSTKANREISVKDMLREMNDDEEYVTYVSDKLRIETSSLL